MKAIDNKELILAIDELCKEKGFEKEYILDAINQALVTAYKKNYDSLENVKVVIDNATGVTHVFSVKDVVEDPIDPDIEIGIDDAKLINPDVKAGETVDVEIVPKDFGRIAAVTAKQVIVQKLREAERDLLFTEFSKRKGDLVSGYVQLAEEGNRIIVDVGKAEAMLHYSQVIPGETYHVNDKIRAYIEKIDRGPKGSLQIKLSRINPNFVKKLFEFEIPEIYEGIIEIKSIARVAGRRTKISVYSPDENIDPVGACVGQKGVRIQNIINELNGEKIDVIEWNEDPAIYISAALSPAEILAVDIDEDNHFAQVIVPDDQLLVAIGRGGENVRLAVNLTDWKIDIKSETQYRKILENQLNAPDYGDIDISDFEAEIANQEPVDDYTEVEVKDNKGNVEQESKLDEEEMKENDSLKDLLVDQDEDEEVEV